jgi:hypothetical protein
VRFRGSHILFRQSAHRWRRGSQPYAPAELYLFLPEDSWYSFLLEAESTPGTVQLEGLDKLKRKISDLIGNRTCNRPACGMVPQPTALLRAVIYINWKLMETLVLGSTLGQVRNGQKQAQLSSAQLSSAQFSSAQLSSAQFSSAQLSSAQLSSAQLSSAQLSSAYLLRNIFVCLNPPLFASCTDTVKLLEACRGVPSSTPPYR